jgi:hypothetical protein
VFKSGRHIGSSELFYVIEVSIWENHLFIAAFDANSPESLMIKIKPDKFDFILQKFESNYELMAESVHIDQKRLILLDPSYNDAVSENKRLSTAPAGYNRNKNAIQHLLREGSLESGHGVPMTKQEVQNQAEASQPIVINEGEENTQKASSSNIIKAAQTDIIMEEEGPMQINNEDN